MAKDDTPNAGRWVDEQMATLSPGEQWEPNVAVGLSRLRDARSTAGHRRPRWIWIGVGATAVTMLLMPTPMARALADRCAEFLLSNFVGARHTRAYAPREQREAVADFTLNDASGHTVTLSDFRGKVVLLNFWTTSCRQCDVEIPWFMEFQRVYVDRLVVLGISLDTDGWTSARPYVEKRQVNYRVMVAEGQRHQLPVMQPIPTTFIVDKSGRIAVRHGGFCSRKEYEDDIRAILAEP